MPEYDYIDVNVDECADEYVHAGEDVDADEYEAESWDGRNPSKTLPQTDQVDQPPVPPIRSIRIEG